jgi:hypothetical protein
MAHAAVEFNHDDPVRSVIRADFFVGDHDTTGLFGVRSATDAEIECGSGQAEIAEEGIRHIGIVMLACVHDLRIAPIGRRQRVVEGGDFHEIRPRGSNEMNHFFGHAAACAPFHCLCAGYPGGRS